MINFINLLIGVAMAAGSFFLGNDKSDKTFTACLKTIGGKFFDTYTEFLGDALQNFVRNIKERWSKTIALKKSVAVLSQDKNEIDADTYQKILDELQKKAAPAPESTIGKFIEKIKGLASVFVKKEKRDARILCSIYDEILFSFDYPSYLQENSTTYSNLGNEAKVAFNTLVQETIDVYVKTLFERNLADSEKLQSTIIVKSLKEFLQDEKLVNNSSELIADKVIEKLLSYCSFNGGTIDLKEIALSRYAPKYILSECPECGYFGERIYTDERNGMTYCAACGKRYSVVRYCEPDLWAQVDLKLDNTENMISLLKELTESNQGENRAATEAILKEFEKLNNKLAEMDAARSEEERRRIEEEVKQLEELRSELKNGMHQLVSQQYFERLLHGQEESLAELKEGKTAVLNALNTLVGQLSEHAISAEDTKKEIENVKQGIEQSNEQNRKAQSDLLDSLREINTKNKFYFEDLSRKTDSIGSQVNQIFEYLKKAFPSMKEHISLLLEYAEKSVTRESVEELTSALGGDVKQAIATAAESTRNEINSVAAITQSGMAQIMSQIDSLKSKGLANDGLVRALRDGNAQLGGQINGMQQLLREHTESSKENFRIIITMLEEQRVSLMASVGLKMGQEEFRKLYHGKIPSMYLYDEGLGGAFPCPYCGVAESRTLNEDQYCRCAVCGNKFLGVNPSIKRLNIPAGEDIWTFLHKNYGKPLDDELYATDERITKWREEHTVTLRLANKGRADSVDAFAVDDIPEKSLKDGLMIFPSSANGKGNNPIRYNTINYLYKVDKEKAQELKTLIFPSQLAFVGIGDKNPLVEFLDLNCIVFRGSHVKLGQDLFTWLRQGFNEGVKIYGSVSRYKD